MNTKHTRVVVTLFLAVAALATMGFSAAPEDTRAASIMPDVATCEAAVASLTAIELLDFVDEPCYANLVDQVETEINWGSASSSSTEALVESILERSRSTSAWSVDLLEQSETEAEETRLTTGSSGPGIYSRVSLVTEAEFVENEFDVSIDYHNPSSPWADSLLVGGAATVLDSNARFEGFIDYHNPGAPDW